MQANLAIDTQAPLPQSPIAENAPAQQQPRLARTRALTTVDQPGASQALRSSAADSFQAPADAHPWKGPEGVRVEALDKIDNPPLPAHVAKRFAGLHDDALLAAIREYAGRHIMLSYRAARHVLFSSVANHDGIVRGVYTGRTIRTQTTPDVSKTGFNTEHTFPRSLGIKGRPGETDLHHLYPTDRKANDIRGNYPFGKVEKVKWEQGGSKFGLDAQGCTVFEPPDAHKGNVARAMFYVSDIYGLRLPDDEEAVLKSWNHLDPVDADELRRNDTISRYQHNRNPFVDQPSLADRVSDF